MSTITRAPALNDLVHLINCGVAYEQVICLDADQLKEAIGALKQTPYIKAPQEAVVRGLLNLKAKKAYYKLSGVEGAIGLVERMSPEYVWHENCSQGDNEILLQVLEMMVSKEMAKRGAKQLTLLLKTDNRAAYLPHQVLSLGPTQKGEKLAWKFSTDLQPEGLLTQTLASLERTQNLMASIRLVDGQGKPKNTLERLERAEQWAPEWPLLRGQGWVPCKGNIAWNRYYSEAWSMLRSVFPDAVAYNGYSQRLAAPILPGGFLPDITVHFEAPKAYTPSVSPAKFSQAFNEVVNLSALTKAMRAFAYTQGEEMGEGEAEVASENVLGELDGLTEEEAWSALSEVVGERKCREWAKLVAQQSIEWSPVPQGTDGSGLYNPKHPALQALVAKYGVVVFQLSLLTDNGVFAKGIMVPREGLPDDVAIQLDPNQVKGAMKGKIKDGDILEHCYVGLLQCWRKPSTLPIGFEQLEMLTSIKDPEIHGILEELVAENMSQLTKKGVQGLVRHVIADNEGLRVVADMVTQLQVHGAKISPLNVPLLKNALDLALGQRLWHMAQGAGVEGEQKVAVLDASLPPGTCVCSGKVGEEVAIWRFPTMLPQGLVTCTRIPPRPQHLWEGKIIPNTIFLHPADLTLCMQGDDDGDIVGVSNDPRIVKLWNSRASNVRFQIEPVGEKFSLPVESEQGMKYLETDPMGPIGLTCIYAAQLLAVNDLWGAVAMAVLNQEAVDSAKRRVRWTDVRKACLPSFWEDKDGVRHLRPEAKLAQSEYESNPGQPEGWPSSLLADWMKERLAAKGCIQTKQVRMEPLAWRRQPSPKKITPTADGWVSCSQKSEGYNGGNWVHVVHDMALKRWRLIEAEWKKELAAEENSDVRELPAKLLALRGLPTKLTCQSWAEYAQTLRCKGVNEGEGGLTRFGKGYQRIRAGNLGPKETSKMLQGLLDDLHTDLRSLSVEEILTIWYWELTPTYQTGQWRERNFSEFPSEGAKQVNRPNYAFRVAAFPGSPLPKALGILEESGCGWASKKAKGFAAVIMASPNPWQELSERIGKDVHHARAVQKDGHPVALIQCPSCVEDLTRVTLRAWRDAAGQEASEQLKQLTTYLNAARSRPLGKKQEVEFQEEEYYSDLGEEDSSENPGDWDID